MKLLILYGLLAACLVCLLAYFGATQALGAHPWWAFDVALYGVVPGIVLSVGLASVTRFAVFFAAFDLALSGAIVWWGKRMFVAASGDNALAGQMWFFGWIAVCACAVAVIALLVQKIKSGAAPTPVN
jgi:hypothetical protein